jgi:hypothetical protein
MLNNNDKRVKINCNKFIYVCIIFMHIILHIYIKYSFIKLSQKGVSHNVSKYTKIFKFEEI